MHLLGESFDGFDAVPPVHPGFLDDMHLKQHAERSTFEELNLFEQFWEICPLVCLDDTRKTRRGKELS